MAIAPSNYPQISDWSTEPPSTSYKSSDTTKKGPNVLENSVELAR